MQFDKSTVVDFIRQQAGSEQAQQAAQQLPDKVDPEAHGDLLQRFGVNPQDLVSRLGGPGGVV
jgi:hypothetical protein